MTGINHKQAHRYLRAAADGLLREDQRALLDAHLRECASCRAEAEGLKALEVRLKKNFQARWDAQDGPSKNVIANIHSRSRRIIMTNRINTGLKLFAGLAALLVLGLLFNPVIRQLQEQSQQNTPVAGSTSSSNLIAFVSDRDGNPEIYTMHTDGNNVINLTNNPASDTSPTWAPDGTRLAFISERLGQPQIFVMNADGSNIVQLTDVPDTAGWWEPLSWSPDGQWIVASRTPTEMAWIDKGQVNLYVINTDGSGATQITTNEVGNDTNPKWSPDGKFIAFLRTAYTQAKIYSIHPDGSNLTALVFNVSNEGIFDWSPDGQLYYLSTYVPCWASGCVLVDEIGIISADGTNQKSLLTLKLREPPCTSGNLISSPDGTRMLIRFPFGCTSEGQLFLVDSDGANFRGLLKLKNLNLSPGEWVSQVNWSPDGRFVVFVTGMDPNQDIYILDVDKALQDPATQPIRLTNNLTMDYSPVWQPQSNSDTVQNVPTPAPQSYNGLIAFASQKNNNVEIYTMHADGSNVIQLTNNSANNYNPIWSPDGKSIAFTSDRTDQIDHTGNVDIFVMNSDGKEQTQLTDTPGYDDFLSWSPDGQKILVQSNQGSHSSTKGQLIIMNADGSNKIALTDQPGSYTFLGWSPDGKKIVGVYQDQQWDGRVFSVDNDGTNGKEGPYFEGDSGRRHYQIHWETPEQFVTLSSNSEHSTWGQWNLTRFYTTGDYTNYIGNNPILVSSAEPIVAIFDKTYVVEYADSLTWLTYEGAPIPLQPWKFSERCTEPSASGLEDSTHVISPNGQQAFVTILCRELVTWFYLENADGSQFVQLTNFSVANLHQNQVSDINWSTDGKYVTAIIADNTGAEDLYRFDIETMLKDPSTKPVQLTTDGAMKYGAVWQPIIKSDIVEDRPTPKPLSFSLTVNEAEALAGFHILEPAYLPAGYTLEGVSYDPQTQKVAMRYVSQNGENGVLYIYQQRGELISDPAVSAYVTPVAVGDGKGEYVRGAWIYDSPDTNTPTWDPRSDLYSLTWQSDGFVFSINFIGGETIPPIFLNELVALAESMK